MNNVGEGKGKISLKHSRTKKERRRFWLADCFWCFRGCYSDALVVMEISMQDLCTRNKQI